MISSCRPRGMPALSTHAEAITWCDSLEHFQVPLNDLPALQEQALAMLVDTACQGCTDKPPRDVLLAQVNRSGCSI
jgi:hypothetical protein